MGGCGFDVAAILYGNVGSQRPGPVRKGIRSPERVTAWGDGFGRDSRPGWFNSPGPVGA